jgi:hypothetical protein
MFDRTLSMNRKPLYGFLIATKLCGNTFSPKIRPISQRDFWEGMPFGPKVSE